MIDLPFFDISLAPLDGTWVLGYDPEFSTHLWVPMAFYRRWVIAGNYSYCCHPTHYMEMPKTPKE